MIQKTLEMLTSSTVIKMTDTNTSADLLCCG